MEISRSMPFLVRPNRSKDGFSTASFSGNYFKGYPAITCNKYGKGIVYYVATVPEQSIADKLMKELSVTLL